jgi:hypothetical protein
MAPAATDADAHLMVQMMEAWLLADPSALKAVFGKGFKPDKIPKWPSLEHVGKESLLKALAAATAPCVRCHDKGTDSFRVLERVDPAMLAARCPSAARLFDALR